MAANGPITGIQQHFNLYRVREIKTQRNVSAATFENERETKISSDEDEGESRRWIAPKIEVEPHRPRVPLPITVKTVVYTPSTSGLETLIRNRRGLSGAMKQTDALSELGIYFQLTFEQYVLQ